MKFATMIWYGDRPLPKAFARAQGCGFDYVELSLDYPWPEGLSREELQALKHLEHEYGLELAFHGPWAGLNLAHPRPELWDASLKIFKRCLRFAGKFNPLYFNFHQMGYAATSSFKEVQERILEQAIRSTSALARLAKREGFPLVVENNPHPSFGSLGHLKLLLREVEDLGLCLDVGHVVVAEWEAKHKLGAPEELVERWFSALGSKLKTVHLHDCLIDREARPKDHLLLGEGSLKVERVLELVKGASCEHLLLETYYKRSGRHPSSLDLRRELGWVKRTLEERS